MDELTESQRTQIAYQYFTLDEWKILAAALELHYLSTKITVAEVRAIQYKFPSAAL